MVNSLRAILIDVSGSMSAGFSGKNEGVGVTEEGPYITKLEGAKDRIIKELSGITGGDIAVISFNSDASLVCKCNSTESSYFYNAINSLQAGGGTSIANALLFALTELGELSVYKYINFVVISDGLDDIEESGNAAHQCNESPFPIRIDTILIDPSDESIQVANAISKPSGGNISNVKSSLHLEEALAESKQKGEAILEKINIGEAKRIQAETNFQKFMTLMAAFTIL